MNFFSKQFSALNKSYLLIILFVFSFSAVYAQPNGTSVSCGTLTGQSLTASGYSGSNATSATGSCGQCCYQGSDLDNDGDADVNFSVENSKWYKYCNPSSTTPYTIDFVVDETNNDCNLQGAVFVTSGTSSSGSTDAVDIDCSNQEYQQFGSGTSGNADGFSFTGVTIPAGGCAWLMVDGYGGASCGAFAIQTICPPACTIPTLATVGADKLICEGSSVALTTTVSGGTTTSPGPTYSWSPSTGLSCTTCQNPTANPTSSTSYIFTVCNGGPGFCCRTDQINVNVTPNFVANAGSDVISCSPSSVTIGGTTSNPTGPSGSTYTWVVSGGNNAGISITSGANTANPVVTINSGLANGSTETYSVTVVNGACTRSDLVTVTVGNLAVNASSDQTVCAGSNIILGGSPTAPAGSTYSWTCSGTACPNLSISSSTVANPIITASSTASGTATYTVRASLSGCINTDVVVVTVNTLPSTPTASAAPSPVCAGQSVTLTASGGAGTGTYSWWSAATNGTNLGVANTLTVSPTSTTTYYLESTNATTGCTSLRGSVTASVNLTPVANAGPDKTLCVGEITTLAGTITNSASCSPAQTWSVISGSGSFSPTANTLNATFTPASSGSIQIRLIPCTTGGCTPVTDDIIFTVAPSPSVTISSTGNPLCQGLISDLSGIVTGGTTFPPTIVTQTFTSASGPFSIPDNNTSGVTVPISVSGVSSPTLGTTTLASVTVNVDHDRIGQIEVWLCPPGTTPLTGCVQLFDNSGGNGDDLVNTVFTDGSSTDIAAGTAPYTGSYNLTGSNTLSSLSGSPTNGTWSLIVIDNVSAGGTTGTAGQWSINFNTPTPVNPYTYSWSPSSALSSANDVNTSFFSSGFTAPTSITHTLTVTDANGCIAKGVITTTIIGTPTLSAGTSQTLCSTSASLSASSLITGESGLWSVVSGTGVFSSTTTNTTSISGLSIGDNFFKWKVTNTCGSDSSQFKITVTSSVTPTFSAVAAICPGKSFSLATSSTNSIPITGSWSPAINNTITTQYTFTPTSGQCALTTTMTVTVNPTPTVTANTTNSVICLGNSTTLTGGGASTYTWTGGVTNGAAFSPTTTASYTVTGTSALGCTNTAVQSITVNPTPTVTANATNSIICPGNSTTLSGGGASTYTWTGGVTNGATFSPTVTTSYTVTGTSAAGCTNTAVLSITVSPTPTVTANTTNSVICLGNSTTLSGGGASTYTWTGGVTNGAAFSPTVTAPYTVTGTSAAGCTNTAVKSITVNPTPTVTANATNSVICLGNSTTLSGGGASTYTWTGGVINGTAFSPTTTASYTVTGTSAVGCTNTAVQSITVSPTPTVTANATNSVICLGNSTTLTGGGASTYTWTGGVINGTAFSPTTTASYTVTGTSAAGCTNTAVRSISVDPTPTITANATNSVICLGNSTTLTGGGASTYTWTGGVTNGAAFSPTTTATYTMTGTSAAGCTNTAVRSITVNPTPTVTANATNPVICLGNSTTLTGGGASTYTWTGSVTDGTAFSPTTTASYTVTGTSAAGCTNTAVQSITVSPTPTVTANATNSIICIGNSTTLSGGGASTYTWTGGVTNGAAFSPTITTSYTVTGTSAAGCTNTAVRLISVDPTPTVTANATNSVICLGNSTTLNGGGAATYTWTGGVTNGATFSPTVTASYTVTGTSAAGCTNTAVQSVTVNSIPTTTATTTGTLTCTNLSVTLNSTLSGMSYTWTAPPGGSVATANAQNTSATAAPGTYTLFVQSAEGCTYSTTTSVTQNTTAPTGVNAGSSQTLTCGSPSVTLNGSVATPTNATILWTGANVCGTAINSITSVCGAGVYTLTATNPINGCISTSTVQVFPSAGAPIVTNNPVTNTITCTNTLVTVSISSTVSPATYTWSGTGIVSGNGTGTITVNQGGTFNYTLTNSTNSCTTSNNQVVVQNTAIPTTTASTTGTLTCIPTSTVALSASLAGMNYTWTAPSGGNVGTANTQSTTASGATGTYSLTVNDPVNGCAFSTTTTVTQNTIVPTTTASTTGTITCNTPSVSLNSTLAGMNYTWTAPAGGSLTGVNTQSTMASGVSGIYSLTVSDPATGCVFSTTASVTQNTAVPTTTTSTTGTLTCNTATVSLNSTLAGMNYTWTAPASGSVTSVNSQSTVASGVSGTYSLTVENPATGCVYSTTTSVTQNTTVPTGVSAGSTQTLTCGSPSVTLSGSVASPTNATFVWTGANVCGSATNSITSACADDNYTLTATDPINGCTSTSTVQVFPSAGAPSVVLDPVTNTITCTNTLVTVSISSTVSPATYTWSGTGIVSGNGTATITVNQGGTFNYTLTNSTNSCSASGNQVVIQNTTAPTGVNAGSNQTLTCGSSSVTLTGSVTTPANTTFLWAGANVCANPTNSITSGCGAGEYTLTATDPINGCTSTSTVLVSASADAPTVTNNPVTNTITCTNTLVTVSISSTVSPATYVWSGTGIVSGNGTETITVNQGGVFNYTVTNTTNSCTTSNNQVVVQNTTIPTTTASTTGALTCATPTIDLNSTLTGMNYTWTAPAGGTLETANTQSTTVSGMSGTYSLTVEDPANGCTFSTTTIVSQNTVEPTTTATTSGTITCNTPSVTLNSTLAGMNYTWTPPAGGSVASANTQSTTASGINGTYSLTVSNPATGCIYSTTTSVTQNITVPTTTATTTGTLTCNTLSVTLNSTLAGMNYTWTPPAGGTFISGINSQSAIISGVGGDYTLSVENPTTGCSYTTTTSVTQNTAAPTGVSAGSNQTLTCLAPTATLNATGSGTYNWSGLGIVSGGTTQNAIVNLQGIYTIIVTEISNGCTSTATTSVIKDTPTPTITIAGTPTLTCLSSTVSLNASGGGTYVWSGPGITDGSSTSTPSVNLPGVYSLTVTGSNGCTSSTTAVVDENMSVTPLVISPDVIIHPGDETNLSITGGSSSYTWSPALGLSCTTCSNPVASPEVTTQYCVDSPEGICSNNACVNVKVEINCENGSDYTTPNAFSPNGDGNNDEFCLQGWNCLSSFYVAIYNRWGNKVFESTQKDFCWDGKYLGKLLDPAVFVFYIKAELIKGDKIDRKGNITLIK